MKCPVCDVTLSISSREGVEIDFCPQCRGVWLDRGELDKIIDRVNGGASALPPPPAPAPVAEARYDRDDRAPRYDDRERERGRYDDRPPRDDDRDRRYDKKKRRKSFLEEIFDFD